MFKILNKKTILVLCLISISICFCLTGAIYSALMGQTVEVYNTFQMGSVSCKVEESFDGQIKENVTVKNTSGIAAFIRSKIIVTWMSEDGKNVYKAKNLDEFENKIKGILSGNLPNLTEEGYKVALSRDIKIVGKKLVEIYKNVMKDGNCVK